MADGARQSRVDLSQLVQNGGSYDFFELLRRLEEDGGSFGRCGGPEREPVRLGQSARLTFATCDIQSVAPAIGGRPPRVNVNVIGLLGPEGPMPLTLTRWIMTRMSNRWFAAGAGGASSDTTFLDFCNVLQHRLIALFWRSWADMQPQVQAGQSRGGPIGALLRSFAGIGLPGTSAAGDAAEDAPPQARDVAKLANATALVQEVRGPARLLAYLSTVTGTTVSLEEFVGEWTALPPGLQSRLGAAHSILGRSAVAGRSYFSRQDTAEITLGPLTLDEFVSFLDDPERLSHLSHALAFAQGQELRLHVRLCLRADEVPAPQLGAARLGQTTWLPARARRDRRDFQVRDVTGTASERWAA